MASNQLSFDELHRYTFFVESNWILKDDDDKFILYLLSNDFSHYFSLTPIGGFVVSLFDGNHSVFEILSFAKRVTNCSWEQAAELVFHLVDQLQNRPDEAIAQNPVLKMLPVKQRTRGDFNFLSIANHDSVSLHKQRENSLIIRRLNTPISLLVFFTNLCETSCRYCYAERRPVKSSKWLSLNEWRRVLAEARALGIRHAGLTGGDVLARKDGVAFIELLIEHDFLFLLSTKCLVKEGDAARMAAAGFARSVQGVHRSLQLSIDSVDPETAAMLTRRPDYLQRAKASLRNLVAVNIVPTVKAVVTRKNKTGFRAYVEDMLAHGVRKMDFTFYEESFYWHSPDLALSNDDKQQISEELNAVAMDYPEARIEGNALAGAAEELSSDRRVETWNARSGCSGGRTTLGIACDGQVVICEQTPQNAPFVFGNVREAGLLDLWNSEELITFISPSRSLFQGTACHDCEEFEHCQYDLGNCFRDAYFATGRPFDAPASCPHRDPVPRIGEWKRDARRPPAPVMAPVAG